MFKRVCLVLLAVCLCVGCDTTQSEDAIEAVGRWVCDQSSAYYFELYEDGSCTMFDSGDEWVSAGTYQTDTEQISFEMDTGSFTWTKGENGLEFRSAEKTYTFHLEKDDNS